MLMVEPLSQSIALGRPTASLDRLSEPLLEATGPIPNQVIGHPIITQLRGGAFFRENVVLDLPMHAFTYFSTIKGVRKCI
jgi:hypothetical protein